jgi:hypothetical protein
MASSETACVRTAISTHPAGVDSRHASPEQGHLAALMSIFAKAHLGAGAPKVSRINPDEAFDLLIRSRTNYTDGEECL